MVLVDPRVLGTLRSPLPSWTDTLGKVVQWVDTEMSAIIDRKDLNDGDKVTLYNQVLQRYNVLSDKRDKKPTRVVVMNDESVPAATPAARNIEADDIVATVSKVMQVKARQLMDRLKKDIAWTERGELIHDGAPVRGSNVVDLVNDPLRKRKKSDPTGWQPFTQQLRAINLPLGWVGNVDRRSYIQQTMASTSTVRPTPPRTPTTPRWTPLARRQRRQVDQPKGLHTPTRRKSPSLDHWEPC